MKVRLTRVAEEDLLAAAAYYDGVASSLGESFLYEVQEAADRIANYPHAWQKLSPNTRRCRLHRFPYGLIYRVKNEES